MLDKLKNLKWHFQLLILLVVAGLLYGAVYYFVTGPTREEVAQLNEQVAPEAAGPDFDGDDVIRIDGV